MGRRSPMSIVAAMAAWLLVLLLTKPERAAGAIIANPLKRPCRWEWEKDGYTAAQKKCIKDKLDADAAVDFVGFTESDGWKEIVSIIKVNPTGVPKLDFITIFKVATAKLCGGDVKSIGASSFGLKLAYDVIARLLNPFYLIPKALSYAPKVGPFFKKVADFFEKPSKKMNELSGDLKDNCKIFEGNLKTVLLVLDILGKIQLGIIIIDELIFPPIVTEVCGSTNAKAALMLMKDGVCHDPSARRNLNHHAAANHRSLLSESCSVRGALEEPVNVMKAFSGHAKDVESVIDTASGGLSPLMPPLETAVKALGVIKDAFEVILEPFLNYTGLFDSLHSVFKYIQCPEAILGPICSIQDLLEAGLNEVLDTFGIPKLDDLADELFDALGIPDLDVALPFDLDFTSPFDAFLRDVQAKLDEFLKLDRSLFDPSKALETALNGCSNGGSVDWTVHITTSTDGLVDFECPNLATRPVVYKADFTRWSCTQDMSGIYRFPCNTDSSCNDVNFGQFSRCTDAGPAGASEFKNFNPDFFTATYFCISKDEDPNVLSVLNIWNTDNYRFARSGAAFPIRGRNAFEFTPASRSHPKTITCNAGRMIHIEARSWLPKKCYGAYYDISDSVSQYRKDLCVIDYIYRSIGPPNYVPQRDISAMREDFTEKRDPWNYNDKQWDAVCKKATTYICGTEFICSSRGGATCEDDKPRACAYIDGDKANYERDCGASDPSYTSRVAEFEKRTNFLNQHYADEDDLIVHCSQRYTDCDGSTECDMVGCELDFFLWSCIDPRTEYPASKVTYHFADTINTDSRLVQCELPRKVMILKAEFGAGFDIQESANAVEDGCDDKPGYSFCLLNATSVAKYLSVPAEGKTVRAETLCACPAGYEILPDLNDECIPCDRGEYRTESMSTCELVPLGYYSSDQQNQRSMAYPCPAGTFSEFLGANKCEQCSAGFWSSTTKATTAETCKPCAPGTVSPDPGRGVTCEVCLPGYEPNQQQTSCVHCPPGSSSPGDGQYCTACDAGTYADSDGQSFCHDASPGRFQPSRGGTQVFAAPRATYVDNYRATRPINCPAGTTTALVASTSVTDCVRVPQPPPSCPEETQWKVSPSDAENCENLVKLLSVTNLEVGNGFCQSCLNVPECGWDGGDCCPETCVKATLPLARDGDTDSLAGDVLSFSCDPRRFECLAPRSTILTCDDSPTLPDALQESIDCNTEDIRIGNGICDPELNSEECGYDGGDCCLFTCKRLYPGVCAPDQMECIDPAGLIDSEAPVLHMLPTKEATISCSTWDISEVPIVTSTDNDPCFEALVTFQEWTDVEPPTCSSRTIWRHWNTSDPQGNQANFTQTLTLNADTLAPVWDEFPPDVVRWFSYSGAEGSLSPDFTGWPTFVEDCQSNTVLEYKDAVILEDARCPGDKLISRNWTVVDACGNSNSRIQKVHVVTKWEFQRALWEGSMLHILATEGDTYVHGGGKKDDFTVVGGSVGAAQDVSLKKVDSLADDVCALPNGVDAYYGSKSKIDGSKSGKEEGRYTAQELDAEYFVEQATEIIATSARLLNDSGLLGLQDGDTKRFCNVQQSFGKDRSKDFDVQCVSTATLSNSTTGVIQDDGTRIILMAPHPVWNVFHLSMEDFFLQDKKQDRVVEIRCSEFAAVIINLQLSPVLESSRSKKGKKSEKVYVPAYELTGGCSSGQILVNLPFLTEQAKFEPGYYMEEPAVMPFSVLAPNVENLEFDEIDIRGQIVAQSVDVKKGSVECPLFQGSFSCSDLSGSMVV